MKLVLLRHATRSPYEGGDSGLSTKGLAQAEKIAELVAPRGPLPQPTRLLVSPKRRAKETLSPTSQALHVPLEIETRLDERHQPETSKEFRTRIVKLLNGLEENADPSACVWMCSHLDWLEAVMVVMNHDMNDIEASLGWSAAEYRVFKLEDGIWKSKLKGNVP